MLEHWEVPDVERRQLRALHVGGCSDEVVAEAEAAATLRGAHRSKYRG
ncbi:hypothetical protein MSM1_07165 [Mycobacterium sp. SM1]|nr:hypothetical protein [Mycobacterium sp. SM1]